MYHTALITCVPFQRVLRDLCCLLSSCHLLLALLASFFTFVRDYREISDCDEIGYASEACVHACMQTACADMADGGSAGGPAASTIPFLPATALPCCCSFSCASQSATCCRPVPHFAALSVLSSMMIYAGLCSILCTYCMKSALRPCAHACTGGHIVFHISKHSMVRMCQALSLMLACSIRRQVIGRCSLHCRDHVDGFGGFKA